MSNTQNLVDIEFALSQLSGNSDLLSRMLIKFSDEFNSVPNKVIQALKLNDLQEAKLQVHTTKGLSGNLGLMALYDCSKKLDLQVRAGKVDDALLQSFADIMENTCEYIKNIDIEAKEPQSFSSSDEPIVDNFENNTGKHTFLERLKHNEFIDDESLFTYINALSLSEEQKQTLKGLVEELQYTKAIDMIKQNT
jgi:HPt (histidine-containing phosphotransfer) domain-containing protein